VYSGGDVVGSTPLRHSLEHFFFRQTGVVAELGNGYHLMFLFAKSSADGRHQVACRTIGLTDDALNVFGVNSKGSDLHNHLSYTGVLQVASGWM